MYEGRQYCSYKLKSESGSQISINFLDLDLPEPDRSQTCITDFVQLKEDSDSVSSLIGSSGMSFCGQQLPNYPGPSVITSGKS